jgi:hypothetical protein
MVDIDVLMSEIKHVRELVENETAHIKDSNKRIENKIDRQNGTVRALEIKLAILEANSITMCSGIENSTKRIKEIENNQRTVIGASALIGAAAGVIGSVAGFFGISYLKG